MADLHITNGDGAANLLKESALAGDVLPWRDPMHHGPFPAGSDLNEVSDLRADYLAGPGLDSAQARRDFRLRNDHLRAAGKYQRVVLWFEHDLLDQLQILQILDWFAEAPLEETSLDMICINKFKGISPFRGLGQLDAYQLASLWDHRHPVTSLQTALARRAWAAFRSPNPRILEGLLMEDLSPLPFLKAALVRHLEDFPETTTGLTRTESQILNLVAAGHSDPVDIFMANMDFEDALFIGDWRSYHHIAALCAGEEPLLTCADGTPFFYPPLEQRGCEAFREQVIYLTDKGQSILAGKRSAFDLMQRDNWLGGVHLKSGMPLWTWHADQGHLHLRRV
ncbi:MAG: hypothetical protein AAF530_15270 [Pseudomonadota bacterium]